MKNQNSFVSRRIGAGLCCASGALQLIVFFFAPAFEFLFKLSTYRILRAGYLIDYQGPLCMFLIASAVIGSLLCVGLSAFALFKPETSRLKTLIISINCAFLLGLIPYFVLLVMAAADSFLSYTINFFALVAYILLCGTQIAGDILLNTGSALSEAAPEPIPVNSNPPTQKKEFTAGGSYGELTLIRMNTQESFHIMESATLGRSSDCAVSVSGNPQIGRHHANIICHNEVFYLTDLNSRNKTYLNDICLTAGSSYPLKEGDYITLANEIFLVSSIDFSFVDGYGS